MLRYRAALDTAVKIRWASTSIPASASMAAISRRDLDEVLVTRPKPIPRFRSHVSVSAAPGRALQETVRTPSISRRTVLAMFLLHDHGSLPYMMSLNTAVLLAVSLATGKLKPHLGQGSASVFCSAAMS